MCGIAGFIHEDKCNDLCASMQLKLHALQECRGPDASSTWSKMKNGVTYHLYHQRLRIQDLSPAADQPMQSKLNSNIRLVFNGEIYNVDEMKSTFLSDTKLRTHSDTEILVEALASNNFQKVLENIRGMFAFGKVNLSEDKIILARDRFGEKPLHFWRDEKRLVFASQYDSIAEAIKLLQLPIEFDQEAIYEYLIYGYFPYHTSFIKGIEKLGPGSAIEIDTTKNFMIPNQFRWIPKWRTSKPIDRDFEILETELEKAIKLQLIGDVPVGVFLSGGCDSTYVSALAQKLNTDAIHSFSLGFENSDFDESEFALKAASELKTNHHAITMTSNDAFEILPTVLRAFAEPLGDPSVLPTTFISREARKYVTVVLTGDGADELFFGYGRYARFLQLNNLNDSILFSRIAQQISCLLSAVVPNKYKSKFLRFCKSLENNTNGKKYSILVGFSHINSVVDSESFEAVVCKSTEMLWNKGSGNVLQNRLREIDVDSYLTDDILTKVDRASMSFALETRAPFLDPKVNQLAQSASELWLNEREQKRAIKQLLEKHVSSEIFRRNKMGFGAPLGDWFRTTLNSWCVEVISQTDWVALGIRTDFVIEIWNQILNSDDTHVTYLWMLLSLAEGVRKFAA